MIKGRQVKWKRRPLPFLRANRENARIERRQEKTKRMVTLYVKVPATYIDR